MARFRSESHRRPIVTAGAARLLAINAVLAHNADESGPLDTQAIEEASTVGGAEPITLAFGEEPWLVLLVSPRSACRYFGVVQADGEVVGIVSVPLGPTERHVGVRVEIPGS